MEAKMTIGPFEIKYTGGKNAEWRRLALNQNTYISAIKELRRVSGLGLKDAKDRVDEWKATHKE
jgi:ribosomal protein L7/L12